MPTLVDHIKPEIMNPMPQQIIHQSHVGSAAAQTTTASRGSKPQACVGALKHFCGVSQWINSKINHFRRSVVKFCHRRAVITSTWNFTVAQSHFNVSIIIERRPRFWFVCLLHPLRFCLRSCFLPEALPRSPYANSYRGASFWLRCVLEAV